MTRDPKLMANARRALTKRREMREREHRRRMGEVYAKSPRAKDLGQKIQMSMQKLFTLALKQNTTTGEIDSVRDENLALQQAQIKAIKAAGFPENYLDDAPFCHLCSDSGKIGNKICDCLDELYREELRKSLSNLLKLGNESFETFKLEYYDDEPGAARMSMEGVFDICRMYAYNFGPNSTNLFLTGAPGLGKTFLSAAIARVVAEKKGSSVVYDTFTSILSNLESEKFGRGEGNPEGRRQAKRYRECDLLIADDLGSEMTTSFTIAALYELINTRLITGKKTIISSNLTPDEISDRYSPQIASRLLGEYTVLKFYGSDIRLKKNPHI